jgi:hypothetical protein
MPVVVVEQKEEAKKQGDREVKIPETVMEHEEER